MKKAPIKNHEYDNVNCVLEHRQKIWQYRLSRELLLEDVIKRVMKANDLEKHLWLGRGVGADPDTFTSLTITWKFYYPYVIGDKQYSLQDENNSAKHKASIFIHVQGDEPGDFQVTVDFDYKDESNTLSASRSFPQKDLNKADLTMPVWFGPMLEKLVKNNTPFYKR